jgi:pyruvate formate lyase activating enzyme
MPYIQTYIKDGVRGTYGVYVTPDELYDEVIKDKMFYEGDLKNFNITNAEDVEHLPGGVTFSGGECLLQINQLKPLLVKLKMEHVHTAVETCLFVPEKFLRIAINNISLFYVDIKILDELSCYEQLNGRIEVYYSNLDILMHSKKPVIFRIPVIGGYTDEITNRRRVSELVCRYAFDKNANLLKVELIKEHSLGLPKYRSLSICSEGFNEPKYSGVTDDLMEVYRQEIMELIGKKIPVEICKI